VELLPQRQQQHDAEGVGPGSRSQGLRHASRRRARAAVSGPTSSR
jgi:hypothetical protein